MAGGIAGSRTGRARGVPRRLNTSTARPPFEVPSAIRSAAGEGSEAASGGLNRKAGARPPSAAICSRLSSAYFTSAYFVPESHASTAPQAFEASDCSAAHSVSWREAVRTMTSDAMSMPAAASAGA